MSLKIRKNGKYFYIVDTENPDKTAWKSQHRTRQGAEWKLLGFTHPHIIDTAMTITDFPNGLGNDTFNAISSRRLRAVKLVLDNKVTPSSRRTFLVESQTTKHVAYHVTTNPDFPAWTCHIISHPNPSKVLDTCPDIQHGNAPNLGCGPRCKHMFAVLIYRMLHEKELSAASKQTESSTVQAVTRTTDHFSTPTGKSAILTYYPDGRPASLSTGEIVKYVNGRHVILLPSLQGGAP